MHSSVSDLGPAPDLAPGLIRLASRLAGASEAEDLVQSTWVRALEHRGPVRARGSWLRQVLVNERRMQLRGRRRRDAREQALPEPEPPADVEDVVHCLEVARLVDRLLDELDDDVRLVVRERYFGGSSAAEIARRHRIPAGTVRWRLKSGLDHLRDQLDARYGGRRALWAGGFLSPEAAPTLWGPAASEPSTVSATTAATGKGTSAMSVKILLAAGMLTATAGGVAWVASDEAEPVTEPAPVAVSANAAPAVADEPVPTPEPKVATKAEAPAARPAPDPAARARWASRLSAIQAAQGQPQAQAHAGGFAWHTDEGEVLGEDDIEQAHFCGADEDCIVSLGQEVHAMMEGCKDFMDHEGPSISLAAHVIGAPGVGTVVESVELSSSSDVPEALDECLTEAMYTLELGPTEENFDHTLTVMIGGAQIDLQALAGAPLDDHTRAAIEQVLANPEHQGAVHFVHLDDGEDHDHAE